MADLVGEVFSLTVQRRRYAALQLLPVIMERVPAELEKQLETDDAFFTARSHCTLGPRCAGTPTLAVQVSGLARAGGLKCTCACAQEMSARLASNGAADIVAAACPARTLLCCVQAVPVRLTAPCERAYAVGSKKSPLQYQLGWHPSYRAACSTGTAGVRQRAVLAR